MANQFTKVTAELQQLGGRISLISKWSSTSQISSFKRQSTKSNTRYQRSVFL